MTKFTNKINGPLRRYEINVWEGLNTIVSPNLSKRGELSYSENTRSTKIGLLEKRAGYTLFGNSLTAVNNFGLYDFNTDQHTVFRVSKVSSTTSIYRYDNAPNTWTQLTGSGTNLSEAECDFTTALDRCFITNGIDANRYIDSNRTTVIDANDSTGMLYGSSRAKLVNYYKDRLYLADYYYSNGVRERTGVCFSSVPVGLVALVSGDQSGPLTSITVSETKYIKPGSANDSLDVYRGDTYIGTLTVTAKTQNTITVSSFATSLLSSDELWVANTRSGQKVFRWSSPGSGIDSKQYDSFKNGSEEDITLMANVGNNMMIFTRNSISLFNGSAIRPLDLEVGCVSKKNFVKLLGQGIFVHYTGIYLTTGGVPKLVSAKIQQIFDNANRYDLEKSCAATDGFSYFVHIGRVTFLEEDNSVKKIQNNVVIEYNLRQNNFYIHTDVSMSHFISFVNQNRERILLFAENDVLKISVNDNLNLSENITVTKS